MTIPKNMDLWNKLLMTNITVGTLEKKIQKFLSEHDEEEEILLSDVVLLFNSIARYFKQKEEEITDYEDDDKEVLRDALIEMYKAKIDELSDDKTSLLLPINIILFAMGYFPLDEGGDEEEDEDEADNIADAFEENEYANFK